MSVFNNTADRSGRLFPRLLTLLLPLTTTAAINSLLKQRVPCPANYYHVHDTLLQT